MRKVAVPLSLGGPGNPAPQKPAGERPHLGWVEIDRLRIDERYQRPLDRHNWVAIRRIAAAFDWSMFTVVDIAPVGEGLFAIIDGQHRVHAAAMVGIDKVPVRIISAPVETQARAFAAINGNVTAISLFHQLRASLAAREHWAVAADEAIRAAGCRLMTGNASSRNKKPGEIYAVRFVRSMVERASGSGEVCAFGTKALRLGCESLIQSVEGGTNPALWTAPALSAWITAVAQRDEWLDRPCASAALCSFLNGQTLGEMLADAEASRLAAKREGRPVLPLWKSLTLEWSGRLDECFPNAAAFVAAGEAA